MTQKCGLFRQKEWTFGRTCRCKTHRWRLWEEAFVEGTHESKDTPENGWDVTLWGIGRQEALIFKYDGKHMTSVAPIISGSCMIIIRFVKCVLSMYFIFWMSKTYRSFQNAARGWAKLPCAFLAKWNQDWTSKERFRMIFPDAQSKAVLVSFGFGISSPQLLFQQPRTQFLLCQIAAV